MNKTSEATQAPGATGDLAVAEAPAAPAKVARKPRGRPLSFDRDAALA